MTVRITNTIVGAIILALIYLAMCFNGGVASFSFEWYPYDLMHNMGHYSSFLIGFVLALIVQITRDLALKQKNTEIL